MGSVTFWVGVVTAALSALSGIKNAYEMHTAQTAEVLYQNTAELKQDAGNTAVAILGIVGGKGQVSGSKQMLEMIAKYPKTFGKRMFIQMKKSFMRKLTWAPRTVAAMFKKDTWKNLYASLRKYLQRNVDEVTDNKPNRDLQRDPVRENVDNNKPARNKQNKPDEKDNVKTDRTADNEKATENYKKHEKDVDDAEKKKFKKDADEDVPDGPDSDSKRRALFMAKVIAEANDAADVPVDATLAELMPLTLMKGVKGFGKEEGSVPGTHKIVMFGSVFTVTDSYDNEDIEEPGGSKGNWNKNLNKSLRPNSRYIVDGYVYETDEFGRIKKVEGNLTLRDRGRNEYQQRKSVRLKDGVVGEDDGGHLIAQIFNGPGEQINYLPIIRSSNQYGAWRAMEREWEAALKSIPPKRVDIEIIPNFTGSSKRPDSFTVRYRVDGEPELINISN